MKKYLIAAGVATLAITMVAVAASYSFNTNLTVGSTGPDVVALQQALMGMGYSIPALSSGAAQPGYFGSQTKTAVMKYQSEHSIPNTGFVGPLTRGSLNSGTSVATTPSSTFTCPVGYTCTANPGTVTTPGQTTTPVVGTTAGISTPGVAGTLSVSLWSTPSGVNVYKGQAYDIASYKLQAGASDMAVSNINLDFSDRLWLYANTITLKDDTGAVIGTLNNLNASNFVEITVGSDYRVSVPVSNLVVKATQTKYITVNVAFNAISDRSTATLYVSRFQVRAVDGTGVTDTETVGDGVAADTGSRSFVYNGSNIGQVYMTTDSAQPAAQLVQLSTSVQTQNVLLGIFDVKSANEPSTLQSLNLQIHTNGKASAGVNELFNNIQIKVGNLTYSAATICTGGTTGSQAGCSANDTDASSTVKFTNLQIPLAADVYTPVSVYVTLAPDTTGLLNGGAASTTLAGGGAAGGTTNNPSVVDATYNNLAVNAATITNNDQTFVDAGVTVPNLSVTYGSKSCDTSITNCNQTFNVIYALQAGNNAIYVSTNASVALSTTTTGGLTYTQKNFVDDNTNGDTSTYFYIAPGQSKTFTETLTASGSSTGGTYKVSSLNYGTTSAGPFTTALTNPSITSKLQVTLFQ
ncbi:MAG: peptidoglycan-binding protein [Patescibacteria group bacterium]|nr:peptidoglycan-binding protein [Patescibacteria group bacterium]